MGSQTGYLRDASWWARPNTTAPKRVHRPSSADPGMAACDTARIMLNTDTPCAVTETNRCRRCFPRLPKS